MKKILICAFIFLLLGLIGTASADTIGNAIIDRANLDGATNIAFIDPTLEFPTDGTLTSISAWVDADTDDRFQVHIYRETATPNYWKLVYKNGWIFSEIDNAYTLSVADPFDFLAGDVLGWWFGSGGGVIPYDVVGEDDVEWTNYLSQPITDPDVGDIYEFNAEEWRKSSQKREYSIAANYTSIPEPTTMLLLGFGLIGLAGLRRKA